MLADGLNTSESISSRRSLKRDSINPGMVNTLNTSR